MGRPSGCRSLRSRAPRDAGSRRDSRPAAGSCRRRGRPGNRRNPWGLSVHGADQGVHLGGQQVERGGGFRYPSSHSRAAMAPVASDEGPRSLVGACAGGQSRTGAAALGETRGVCLVGGRAASRSWPRNAGRATARTPTAKQVATTTPVAHRRRRRSRRVRRGTASDRSTAADRAWRLPIGYEANPGHGDRQNS